MSVTTAPAPTADDVEPCENERLDRFLTGTITVLPFIGLGIVAWQAWASLLRWSDVIVFAIMYVATGLGVTVGFHRMLTHRAFQTHRFTRYFFAYLGMLSVQGPVID